MSNVPLQNLGVGGQAKNYEDEMYISSHIGSGGDNFQWTYTDKIFPINQTSENGPYIFEIRSDPTHFKDLRTMRIGGKVRIRVNNAASVTGGKVTASTINNYIHSMFSNIQYSVEGVEFADSTRGSYPYIAYLQTLLSYSSDAKKQSMSLAGWEKDTPGLFDDVTTTSSTIVNPQNGGYRKRGLLFGTDNYFDFRVKLLIDLCNIDQYLIPGVRVRITLTKSDDNFALLSNEEGGVTSDLKNLHLSIDNLLPTHSYAQRYERALTKSNATYIFDKNLIRFFTFPSGISDLSIYNVISSDCIPSMIFIGIVQEKAVNGDLSLNPFNFVHANTSECYLQINGVNLPMIPTSIDIAKKETNISFSHFLESCGVLDKNTDISINKDDWLGGTFLHAFDLNPDKCGNYHHHPAKGGSLNLILKLASSLTTSHKVIVYGTYRDSFEIDKDHNVIYKNLDH